MLIKIKIGKSSVYLQLMQANVKNIPENVDSLQLVSFAAGSHAQQLVTQTDPEDWLDGLAGRGQQRPKVLHRLGAHYRVPGAVAQKQSVVLALPNKS